MANENNIKIEVIKPIAQPVMTDDESYTEPEEDLMKTFMEKADLIKTNFEIIEACNKEISRMNNYSRVVNEEEKLTIDDIIDRTEKSEKEIKKTFEELNADITMTEKKLQNKIEAPEIRSKKQIINSLKANFKKILIETSQVQTEYKKNEQNRIKRQLRIVKPELTDEEIEVLSKDPDSGKRLLNEMVLGPHATLVAAVSDIRIKYQHILRLEKSVNQIHKMFEDMALLVHEQALVVDNIEKNVKESNDYLEKGEKKLATAKKWYQKTRTVKTHCNS